MIKPKLSRDEDGEAGSHLDDADGVLHVDVPLSFVQLAPHGGLTGLREAGSRFASIGSAQAPLAVAARKSGRCGYERCHVMSRLCDTRW